MWEFSVIVSASKIKIAEFLFDNLKKTVTDIGGVITSFEENGKVSVVLACDEVEKNRLAYYIKNCISEAVCFFYKKDYLNANLKMPTKDNIYVSAFKKAMLKFDKETDKFLVSKYLELNKNLYLDSFFNFRLQSLKNKWTELVKIANENNAYLANTDTFIELIKFLVDNLEVLNDTINVVKEDEGYQIFNEAFERVELEKEEAATIISDIVALSPRKINVYTSESEEELSALGKIFTGRVNYFPSEIFYEKTVDRKNKI